MQSWVATVVSEKEKRVQLVWLFPFSPPHRGEGARIHAFLRGGKTRERILQGGEICAVKKANAQYYPMSYVPGIRTRMSYHAYVHTCVCPHDSFMNSGGNGFCRFFAFSSADIS